MEHYVVRSETQPDFLLIRDDGEDGGQGSLDVYIILEAKRSTHLKE